MSHFLRSYFNFFIDLLQFFLLILSNYRIFIKLIFSFKQIYLDKCDISTSLRKSAEKLFISRFSLPPICQEHKSTLERLKATYGLSKEPEKDGKLPSISQYSGIQTRRLFLSFEEKSTIRSISLSLPLHKVVGLGARLFGFEPDQLKGVEIQRSDPNFFSELIARTKDNLLRQFDLEDGDTIRFVQF
ncbi:unnamed protein product [Meloidogyne enterolobii]|uniref:Uncharacterized protein n=1 Tax=Meloidogyne enterolobii TaxID=390850 RepID=A0ACB0ZQU9_MELEN